MYGVHWKAPLSSKGADTDSQIYFGGPGKPTFLQRSLQSWTCQWLTPIPSVSHNCNKEFNIQNDRSWEGQAEGGEREDGCWGLASRYSAEVSGCWNHASPRPVSFTTCIPKTLTKICSHRLAEKKWLSQFTAAARQVHSDMGLVSLSIIAYTNKNGQLVVDMSVITMFPLNIDSPIWQPWWNFLDYGCAVKVIWGYTQRLGNWHEAYSSGLHQNTSCNTLDQCWHWAWWCQHKSWHNYSLGSGWISTCSQLCVLG